jgi:hypothetical protein
VVASVHEFQHPNIFSVPGNSSIGFLAGRQRLFKLFRFVCWMCASTALSTLWCQTNTKQTQWSESASELYRPNDRRLTAKWLPTFADRGFHVVNVMNPYALYSRFSRQEQKLFYQVAPQLYSRGWVDPVPDPLLFLLVPGIEPGPPNLQPRTLTTRPQRRSLFGVNTHKWNPGFIACHSYCVTEKFIAIFVVSL